MNNGQNQLRPQSSFGNENRVEMESIVLSIRDHFAHQMEGRVSSAEPSDRVSV